MRHSIDHIRLLSLALIVVAVLVYAPMGDAQSGESDVPELVTDRPDQTESSVVVPRGYVQIETGITYTDDGSKSSTLEYPSTLVRVGVLERLELRVGTAGFVTEFEGGTTTGFGDSDLGVKVFLWEENGWRPEAAILAGTSVPTGNDAISSHRFDPAFRLSFAHTLTDKWSLGYNLGAAWESTTGPTPAGGRHTLSVFQYTLAAGVGITEQLGAFIEIYGDIPLSASGGSAHSLDGGFTYLLRPNLQLDLAGGFGLTSEADNWFIGTGLSVRFPH